MTNGMGNSNRSKTIRRMRRSGQARLHATAVDMACPPGALLEDLARLDDPVMLDSSALHDTYGRYSILACRPAEVLILSNGVLRDSHGATLAEGQPEAIWSALGQAFGAIKAESRDDVPYAPGWIGYVGYETGRCVERLPCRALRDTALPDLRLAFYDSILLYDALSEQWSLVSLRFDAARPFGRGSRDALLDMVRRSSGLRPVGAPQPADRADASRRPAADDARANFTPEAYRRAVKRCTEYIAAGDIFQVNLSQRFTVRGAPPPTAIYRALRNRNPAWYSAFMTFESYGRQCAVLSSSPELFLRVRRGHVTTRPIKGTRRRTDDPIGNARAAAGLLSSPKDNAELAMIIDLLRNDLGRVCAFGSMRVSEPRSLETHPTVFHLVGTVEGDLRAGVGPAELLRATFPGGSITGAPKIRAMEIIDELEPVARGPYTGCIGLIGVDGGCELNIVIRTVVCDAGNAYVQAGGGIVADSTPEGEYQETLDKARALLEAIAQARTRTGTYREKRGQEPFLSDMPSASRGNMEKGS